MGRYSHLSEQDIRLATAEAVGDGRPVLDVVAAYARQR